MVEGTVIYDSLKTARRIYHVFIVACVTFLAFALSPDKTTKYIRALEELQSLRELQLDSIPSKLINTVRPIWRKTKTPDEQILHGMILGVVNDTSHIIYNIEGATFSIAKLGMEPISLDSPLVSIDRYVRSDVKPYSAEPNEVIKPDSVVRASQAELIKSLKCKPPAGRINKYMCEFIYEGYSNGQYTLRSRSSVDIIFSEKRIPVRSEGIRSWLMIHSAPGLLFSNGHFLPATHEIWSEVGDLTVPEAISYLEQKINIGSEDLSLLGLSINGKTVFITAPFVLCSILVVFAMVITHMQRMADEEDIDEDDVSKMKEFGWISIYPNRFSGMAYSIIVLFLLPAMTCLIMIIREYNDKVGVGYVMLVGLWNVVCLLGVFCIYRLDKFQIWVHDKEELIEALEEYG